MQLWSQQHRYHEKAISISGEWWKSVLYSLLCTMADTLDIVLSVIAPSRRPQADFLPSDVDGMSDDEILGHCRSGTQLVGPGYGIIDAPPNIVVKLSQDMDEDAAGATEANALDLVFAMTTIPVPRVRRVIYNQVSYLIIMDYVKGPTLNKVWKTFSIWRKVPPSQPPGPLSPQGLRQCESPVFGNIQSRRGPFVSYEQLTAFCNRQYKLALDITHIPEDHPWRTVSFDDSSPLVLTHQDLNPRNIIVGEDGRLWIIDWAWAGYYPPWFEYVTMQRQAINERTVGFSDKFWNGIIPFVCGPHFKQEQWSWRVEVGMYYGRTQT